MIAACNYTNYLYRPRRPEELDTAQGGGILFNQVPHQIDIVRAHRRRAGPQRPRAGDRARSVAPDRGQLRARFLQFENGAAASLVYSGYDFFDTDELHFWISRARRAEKPPDQQGAARRALAAPRPTKSRLRVERFAYGSAEAARRRRTSRISASSS